MSVVWWLKYVGGNYLQTVVVSLLKINGFCDYILDKMQDVVDPMSGTFNKKL